VKSQLMKRKMRLHPLQQNKSVLSYRGDRWSTIIVSFKSD